MFLRTAHQLQRPQGASRFITSVKLKATVRNLQTRPAAVKLGQQSSQPTTRSSLPGQERTMSTVKKSEDEWKVVLSPEQFRVLRKKGTERAGTGEYDEFNKEGTYGCAGCGTPLYKSSTKFNSGCGWPAFFDAIPGAVSRHEDTTLGMRRVEITCTACDGHLGHIFEGEGFPTPTDERHCVNSVSLKFHEGDGK